MPVEATTRKGLKAKKLKISYTGIFVTLEGVFNGTQETVSPSPSVVHPPERRGQPQAGEAAHKAAYRGRNQVGEAAAADQETLRHALRDPEKFRDFLEVDLNRAERTVYGHLRQVGLFSDWLDDRVVTRDIIREYLRYVKREKPGEYENVLKTAKVFFRDFLSRGDLVSTFRFPEKQLELKRIPPKKDLQKFYQAARRIDLRLACYFLLWATSGWRFLEVFVLHREDVDLETRMMAHRLPSTTTKGRLFGCFNEEAEDVLKEWLEKRSDKSPKLLPINQGNLRRLWRQAEEQSGVHLKPKQLREWFCEEMSNLEVPERYIDAFCGRVPKKVLAKHYTDYAPEKLKKIYDKAGLRVLS